MKGTKYLSDVLDVLPKTNTTARSAANSFFIISSSFHYSYCFSSGILQYFLKHFHNFHNIFKVVLIVSIIRYCFKCIPS